jgi:lauroyl/myristoyl acyltransferase
MRWGRTTEGLGKRCISIAEFCFAKVLRLFPYQYRFKASILIAQFAVPLIRLTATYRQQLTTKVDGPREITLHFILNALTKNGTTFNPVIHVKGYENFERASTHEGGLLVTGPHAALNLLLIRLFYEKGFDPIVITPDPRMRIGGTTVVTRTIQRSPIFLVKTKNYLRQGEIICGMPDRAEHHPNRTVEFETANGPVIFAPALLQVAAKCGAAIVFTEVHLEGRKLVSNIVTAKPISEGKISSLNEEFIKFVRWHIDAHLLPSLPKKARGITPSTSESR